MKASSGSGECPSVRTWRSGQAILNIISFRVDFAPEISHAFDMRWTFGAIAILAMAGCGTSSFYAAPLFQPGLGSANRVDTLSVEEHDLPMFAGATGRSLSEPDLAQGLAWANVVIIGEIHDDAVGHAAQTAIARRLCPESSTPCPWTLSMEMLERDDQPAADDFVAGRISREDFVTITKSADWAGKGSWEQWYQPTIDAMTANGNRLIAANAPRTYVRKARQDGYDSLRSLPPEEQALFALPIRSHHGEYERRFIEWATGSHRDGATPHGSPDDEAARQSFRSQLVWDATMADSIATRLIEAPESRVLHLEGQFHVDFNGGTLQELRARVPEARVLTISLQPVVSTTLRAEDRGRADVVIYTGIDSRSAW